MKILYILGALVSLVVILILSFENIQSTCNYLTFFFWELPASVNPTFILMGSAFVGIITGAFMTMAAISLFGSGSDEDDSDVDFAA